MWQSIRKTSSQARSRRTFEVFVGTAGVLVMVFVPLLVSEAAMSAEKPAAATQAAPETARTVPTHPRVEVASSRSLTERFQYEVVAERVAARTPVLTPAQVQYLEAVAAQAEADRQAAEAAKYGGLPLEWVPDKPGDAWYTAQMETWRAAGICIIKHESATAGGPLAQNSISTASGLFQFVNGTWHGHAGVGRARLATPTQQWERFFQVWNDGHGKSHWNGTHCAGAH